MGSLREINGGASRAPRFKTPADKDEIEGCRPKVFRAPLAGSNWVALEGCNRVLPKLLSEARKGAKVRAARCEDGALLRASSSAQKAGAD